MRFQELTEAPLPDDWDKEVFGHNAKFKKMIEYAKMKAPQLGKGSSRVAFGIKYQGRDTVLKVALNTKGLMQNAEEAKISEDWYIQGIDLLIPVIDFEERTNNPTWIHTEYASPMKKADFRKFLAGFDLGDVITHIEKSMGRKRFMHSVIDDADEEKKEALYETELFMKLQEYTGNTDNTLEDLDRKANWGLYKGEPRVIDFGFTPFVRDGWYSR